MQYTDVVDQVGGNNPGMLLGVLRLLVTAYSFRCFQILAQPLLCTKASQVFPRTTVQNLMAMKRILLENEMPTKAKAKAKPKTKTAKKTKKPAAVKAKATKTSKKAVKKPAKSKKAA